MYECANSLPRRGLRDETRETTCLSIHDGRAFITAKKLHLGHAIRICDNEKERKKTQLPS